MSGGPGSVTRGAPTGLGESVDVKFEDILGTVQKRMAGDPGNPGARADKMLLTNNADKNHDGFVEAGEMTEWLKDSYPEITSAQTQRFINAYDYDGDGKLDKEELTVVFGGELPEQPPQQSGGSEGGEHAGGGEGGGGGGGSGGAQGLSGYLKLLLKLLDIDGDGKVSEEEKQAFIDKYGGSDGQLSKEELITGLKAEAKAKNVELSDEQINAMGAGLDATSKSSDTDGKPGIGLPELGKVLETSAGAEADA
jgi:Ca2+-binding EF-hand superfamily protein